MDCGSEGIVLSVGGNTPHYPGPKTVQAEPCLSLPTPVSYSRVWMGSRVC